MLRRAKRLSTFFDQHCDTNERHEFRFSKAEWRQIDYLLYITEPFYRFTTVLSKTKDITVHNVFRVYNALFEHFEKSIERLAPKSIPWKVALLNALHAGMNKLSVYYTKTKEIHGRLYAIGTILAPQHKLNFFSSKIWGKSGDDSDWSMHYKESLCEFMKPYAQRLSQTQPLPGDLSHRHTSASSSEIEDLFERGPQLPVLSSVARDILSIPATGAGVERLFNSARDICHYQRGQLNSATIQDIMMFRCKSRFEIEVDEFPREDLTPGAAQVVDEQREAQLAAEEPGDISEGEDFSDNEDNNDPVAVIEDEFIMESQH